MVREKTSLPKMESIRSEVAPSGSSTRVGMDTRVGVVTERCASLAGSNARERAEHNHPARAGDSQQAFVEARWYHTPRRPYDGPPDSAINPAQRRASRS